jgi:hypothetical protein
MHRLHTAATILLLGDRYGIRERLLPQWSPTEITLPSKTALKNQGGAVQAIYTTAASPDDVFKYYEARSAPAESPDHVYQPVAQPRRTTPRGRPHMLGRGSNSWECGANPNCDYCAAEVGTRGGAGQGKARVGLV